MGGDCEDLVFLRGDALSKQVMQITLFYTIKPSFLSFSERSWQDKAIRDVKLLQKNVKLIT